MPQISNRARGMPVSGLNEILDLVQEKEESLIDLGVGEPDFNTPDHIINAANQAAKEGETHYTETAGIKDLRSSISKKLSRKNKIESDPDEEIIVTSGGTSALSLFFLTVCDPGDEVIVPDPGWSNYKGAIKIAGAEPVSLPLREERGFKLEPESLVNRITDSTQVIVLNSPSNPTGAVFEESLLREVGNIAKREDVWVCSDEPYEAIIYDNKSNVSIASFPGMFEQTVSFYSFSKTYAMTGWRVGYAVGPSSVVSSMAKLQQHAILCPSSISQAAALAALKGPDSSTRRFLDKFAERRELVVSKVDEIDKLTCKSPEGTFYAFINIKELDDDSMNVVRKLLDEGSVATIPGTAFGEMGEGYIRLSFANSKQKISKGLSRIEEVVNENYS